MGLVCAREIVEPAFRNGYAVGAFNTFNAETTQTIIEAATALNAPVMLMLGNWDWGLLNLETYSEIITYYARRAPIPVTWHLDHARSLDTVKDAVEAGYTSVMIDGSHLPFEENVAITKAAVALARPRGIAVEAELGGIGPAEAAGTESAQMGFTDPEAARRFCQQTGVDMLAVSIGNAHGIYKVAPQLDIDLLRQIHAVTEGTPLVLHGGSTTPPDQVRAAVKAGIAKVNVASELWVSYAKTMRQALGSDDDRFMPSVALRTVKAGLAEVVARWIKLLGSEGKAAGP
jgi:fructose-bisphosphate aldolase class II/tagatose 1,6-diphosphate aldolase GatY/KbaY